MRYLIVFSIAFFALLPGTCLDAKAQEAAPPQKTNQRPEATPTPTPSEPFEKTDVAAMKSQCAVLQTEAGNISLEFFPESAPETVRNFLNLSALGAYDTTTFDRVVKAFIIQGGSPSTRETFPPGMKARMRRNVPDEPNKVLHVRGIVSMAKSDEPNSASSHFFILLREAPYLDNNFAAFGRVTSGMDVVEAINSGATEGEKPLNPVRISKVVLNQCK